MSLQPFVPWLIALAVLSVATMVIAAGWGDGAMHALAALPYTMAIGGAGLAVNLPYWRSTASTMGAEDRNLAARRNARTMALIHAWAASAIAADYSLAPLDWHLDWLYTLVFALAAVICFTYAVLISPGSSRFRRPRVHTGAVILAGLQLLIASAAVFYLLVSGKLWTFRSDWAANQVILFAAGTLALISTFAVLTDRRLNALASPAAPTTPSSINGV